MNSQAVSISSKDATVKALPIMPPLNAEEEALTDLIAQILINNIFLAKKNNHEGAH